MLRESILAFPGTRSSFAANPIKLCVPNGSQGLQICRWGKGDALLPSSQPDHLETLTQDLPGCFFVFLRRCGRRQMQAGDVNETLLQHFNCLSARAGKSQQSKSCRRRELAGQEPGSRIATGHTQCFLLMSEMGNTQKGPITSGLFYESSWGQWQHLAIVNLPCRTIPTSLHEFFGTESSRFEKSKNQMAGWPWVFPPKAPTDPDVRTLAHPVHVVLVSPCSRSRHARNAILCRVALVLFAP